MKIVKQLITDNENSHNLAYQIFSGDFNAIVDKHLNKMHLSKHQSYLKLFDTFNEKGFIDSFRAAYPHEKKFTWTNGTTST